MPNVNIPGLGVVRFPDSMSVDEINAEAEKLYRQNSSSQPSPGADWASAARNFQGNSTPTYGAPVRMENVPPSLRKMTQEDKDNAAREFLDMTGLGKMGAGVKRIQDSGGPLPDGRTQKGEVLGGIFDMGEGAVKLASPILAGWGAAAAVPMTTEGLAAIGTKWGAAKLAGGVLGGTVGAGVGAYGAGAAAEALGAEPGVVQGAEDLGGLAGGFAGGWLGNSAVKKAQDMIVGNPVKNTIQSLRPSNKKVDFEDDIKLGNPIIKAQETQLGRPIKSVEDYLSAAELAKKQLGQQIEGALGPGRLTGATIDGNKVVSAAVRAIPDTVRQENPGMVARLMKSFDGYRRPISLDEADNLRIEWNAKLASDLYNKYPNAQPAALKAQPRIATRDAMVTELRRLVDEKLNQLLPGNDFAAIRRDYGAVTELQDSALRRLMVANRQADLSLHERFQWAKAIGKSGIKVLTGNVGGALGDIAEAGASTAIKEAATSNTKIANAMRVTVPASPRPVPRVPAPAALLESGPIRMGTPDTSGPTGGVPQEVLDLIANGRMTPQGQFVAPPARQLPAGTTPVGVSGTLMPDAGGNIRGAVNREMAGPRMLPAPQPGNAPVNLSPNYGQGNIGFGSQHSAAQPPPMIARDQIGEFIDIMNRLQAGQGPKLLGPAKRGSKPYVLADFLEQLRRMQKK